MKKSSHSFTYTVFIFVILLVLASLVAKIFRFSGGPSIFGRLLMGGFGSSKTPPTPTPVFLVLPTPPDTSKPAITPKPRL